MKIKTDNQEIVSVIKCLPAKQSISTAKTFVGLRIASTTTSAGRPGAMVTIYDQVGTWEDFRELSAAFADLADILEEQERAQK